MRKNMITQMLKASQGLMKHSVLVLAVLGLMQVTAQAATVTKSATGTDLTDGASWGGTAPTSGDVAFWVSTSLGTGLTLGSSSSWGSIGIASALSAVSITGAGPLTLGAGGIDMTFSAVNLTVGTPITLGASQNWTVNSGRTLAASGIISGTSMSLTKAGLGTLTLTGTNTYTGDTIVNAGTLTLGSGANGSLSSSSALKMGGGSTFNYSRTGAGQIVNGLTINAGNSTVNNTSAGQTLTLDGITRTAAAFGTVNFATLTGPINTTFANVNGIIGPWATTGSAATLRYAVGGGNISGLTGTAATAADLSNVTDSTLNYEYSAATATVGNLTGNTLRYSGAATTTAIGAANTLTLNGLMNAGTGLLTISGGPSTGGIIIGNTDELVITANAQATTISAVIANGGSAGTLVYAGGGTLTLSGTNLYTGGTVINAGTLVINNNSALGSGAVTVAANAVLGLSVGGAGEFTMAQAATLFTNLTTAVNNNGMRPNSFMSLDTRNASAGTYTFSGVLADSTGTGGGAVNFEFNGTSTTTLELTGSNTYSGVTMVRNNGTLKVSSFNSVNGGNPPMAI
jgi:autotransporter-associated beta strand protein